ncbi:hypothetical protein LJC15_00430 [Desulfovibrio sp. OttesenSCG-928-G11]|nr:hypothetical protein [Desulfovibrio sp. OttesenSCG-928-G11]
MTSAFFLPLAFLLLTFLAQQLLFRRFPLCFLPPLHQPAYELAKRTKCSAQTKVWIFIDDSIVIKNFGLGP